MTDSKTDIVTVAKIEGDKVEIGLSEFIEMCNAVRQAKEIQEANEWLQKARIQLLDELQFARQNAQPKELTSVVVYRRDPAGNLHVQYIEGMQQGSDNTVYVTIGEPS